MQTKKEEIRDLILRVAKEEFFEKGFKSTSMRGIASKSNVSLSNIYNYFRDKNEILDTILKPVINCLDQILEDHNKAEYLNIAIFESVKYQEVYNNMFLNLVFKYKEELKLLMFKSSGSSFENFIYEYSDRHEKIGYTYLKKMKEKYPNININISDFFIHTLSSSWLTSIGEIVSHDLSETETKQFIREYMAFTTAGWKKIMGA
ncbi:MAG: TetR/AcrR family transcriptional regulator [Marinifilaceae bacterium]|jgi:AcrR family transcriptional regulator|nr:TetR/AcrR family transcriptional regulator [Marinifilaceae bacterium]